jgi:hypothetical protein
MNTFNSFLINSFRKKIKSHGGIMLSGAILVGALSFNLMANSRSTDLPQILPLRTAHVMAGEAESSLPSVFLGSEVSPKAARALVAEKAEFVSTRKAYSASLAVIQKHEGTIRTQARTQRVPEEIALGVGLLENGGSETAMSPAGALGVFQLMPGTARNLGLVVNKQTDERLNPEKNITAGVSYLRKNYDRFGDWGLSTWAYHAGEGNVTKALRIYAKANHNIELPGVGHWGTLRAYVEEHNITIHKLLSDPAVRNFTQKLNDDSSGYPYKVLGTAKLFEEAAQYSMAR